MSNTESSEFKYPIVGSKLILDFDRVDSETIAGFADFPVPDIADLVGVMYCMDYSIRPAYQPMTRVIGSAFTVKVPPGDNLLVRRSTYLAKPGDVIVIDSRGHTDWCLGGGGMCAIAKERGVAGLIADGAFRDIGIIQEAGFPLFCRGVHPSIGPKRGPGEMNVPVCSGGVIVHPGDVVVGDEEGVVVIPRLSVGKVLARLREQAASTDNSWESVVDRGQRNDEKFAEIVAARGFEVIERA